MPPMSVDSGMSAAQVIGLVWSSEFHRPTVFQAFLAMKAFSYHCFILNITQNLQLVSAWTDHLFFIWGLDTEFDWNNWRLNLFVAPHRWRTALFISSEYGNFCIFLLNKMTLNNWVMFHQKTIRYISYKISCWEVFSLKDVATLTWKLCCCQLCKNRCC